MAVNARTEEFQHIEVFDKPALFTNGRIARDTVPKGWYCYDIRGSDDDPGELCYMEENVVVNHAGSVLMPEKLAMPKSGRLDVRDELGFLDEGNMTLREFCEAHQLPYPAENMKFHIRPARPEEAGLFYTPHPEEDKRLGMLVMCAASVFSYYLTWESIPQKLSTWLSGFATNPTIFLLLVTAIFLVIGMFMDGTTAMIIMAPILGPVAQKLGIDSVKPAS